jgi:hypothetical protein
MVMVPTELIIIAVFVALLLLLLFQYIPAGASSSILQEKVRILTRQAARWSTAATQDENPLIAVLHANYGAGYLWAINDIVTSEQFNQMTGYDYTRFRDEITKIQDMATKKMISVCPDFAPQQSYLLSIGSG